jgi:uncharacterized protein YjlB
VPQPIAVGTTGLIYRRGFTPRKIRLGGTVGVTIVAEKGDMLILPAGTGHQNLGASADFHVVGGYPEGQSADLLRGKKGERPAADERIARVALPAADPLSGANGPLIEHWKISARRKS